ncbi:MAG: hypothetical protein EHM70_09470 [Chloroflexota bacterium]|nr:MAG: hypothetical protein EHM70_09470 [Chloroflexota bacterium]
METTPSCPECKAVWRDGITCQDHFYQMLFWENENPALGEVHHLMVLSYHLQHPSLYSPDGLKVSMGLLDDFLVKGLSTKQVRKRNRDVVDSGNRSWKIKARPDSHGSYDAPVTWTMTAADVVANGAEGYIDSVRSWAESIRKSLNR